MLTTQGQLDQPQQSNQRPVTPFSQRHQEVVGRKQFHPSNHCDHLMKSTNRQGTSTVTSINNFPNDSPELRLTEEPASLYGSIPSPNGLKNGTSRLLLGFINSLSKIVELRDYYTANHQRRVTRLARAIAREMGLTEDQVITITVAGLLHDVGKACVPTSILNKSGPLTDAEFFMVKSHPEFGYDILKEIELEWPVADIVLQHHERLDGSGYPQGLVADQIRFETQILSVADVVEAMSAHRPYRPSLGLGRALNEVLDKSGTLFNPDIVSACIRVCHQAAVRTGKE
jgi:putative nucleotidyltransferase with HDIG domain